uniref:Uncharacterized protein n=1 Tax=Arion vulgaris TaxID=1028688 RepID=A0A0B6Y4I3_9EUPU
MHDKLLHHREPQLIFLSDCSVGQLQLEKHWELKMADRMFTTSSTVCRTKKHIDQTPYSLIPHASCVPCSTLAKNPVCSRI